MTGRNALMNNKELNPYESPESTGEQGPSVKPSLIAWLGFSASIAVIILLFRMVLKLPERMGSADLHWLTGNVSIDEFLISHAIFIAAFSIVMSLIAYFRKIPIPWPS